VRRAQAMSAATRHPLGEVALCGQVAYPSAQVSLSRRPFARGAFAFFGGGDFIWRPPPLAQTHA
jgi:hypothetical protein